MKTHQYKHKKFDSPMPAPIITAPFSHVYSAVTSARNFVYDTIPALSCKLSRPTISIGGIRAGGTGKTPTARLVGEYIANKYGYTVAFLSRGYGRHTHKHVIVKPGEKANWKETGDEPYMLHSGLPGSWLGIGADRTTLAKKLSPLIPDKSVFILDDGFQRRQTHRDLDIVCLSENTLDDRLIPSGYLREPISSLARAHILFIIGAEERIGKLREIEEALSRRFASVTGNPGERCMSSDSEYNGVAVHNRPQHPISAILLQYPHSWVEARSNEIRTTPPYKAPAVVTGIARPDRFIAMLRALSVDPSGVHNFRDHHNFKKKDIASIHNIYSSGIVTTEKDAVRLLSPEFISLREIWYLKIGLRFAEPESEALAMSLISESCHRSTPEQSQINHAVS